MTGNWKEDPRVKDMDSEKLDFLTQLTEQIRRTPRQQMMTRLLALTSEAGRRGIVFTNRETDILAEVLTEQMDPKDRGKAEMFRMLSRKIAK